MNPFVPNEAQEYEDSTLKEVSLQGPSWRRSRFFSITFDHVNGLEADLRDCSFLKVTFLSSDFSAAKLDSSLFKECRFVDCKFYGSSFADSSFESCHLSSCNLTYSVFDGVTFKKKGEMRECNLNEASITRCHLGTTVFHDCDFTRASFMGTPLRGQDFSSCTLDSILVSENHHELAGLRISHGQAASLAALLGVIIEN